MHKQNHLRKLAPAWHAEAVEMVKGNFASIHTGFVSATKQAVWLGIFLIEIKERGKRDTSIPHGEFGPWLKRNLPDLCWETTCSYMRLARDVCEKGRIQISEFSEICRDGKLPEAVLRIVEGKTRHQLFLEFKQARTDADGNLMPARGRRVGEGAAPLPVDLSEGIARRRQLALQRAGKIFSFIERIATDFVLLTDEQCELLLASYEKHSKALHCWLNQPKGKRDIQAVENIWENESRVM